MLQFLTILLDAQKSKMDERGASAVEYGLLVAGIALAIVTAVFLFGDTLSDLFDDAEGSLASRTGN